MKAFLAETRKSVKIGVVGGSDLNKIKEQLGEDSASLVKSTSFCFTFLVLRFASRFLSAFIWQVLFVTDIGFPRIIHGQSSTSSIMFSRRMVFWRSRMASIWRSRFVAPFPLSAFSKLTV
jgi:hypothetical protein